MFLRILHPTGCENMLPDQTGKKRPYMKALGVTPIFSGFL